MNLRLQTIRMPVTVVAGILAMAPAPVQVMAAGSDSGAPLVVPAQRFPHGYLEATLSPGQSFSTTLLVTDSGSLPATYLVTAVDGYTSTASGVVYGNRQKPLLDGPSGNGEYGAGSWVTVSPARLDIAAGQTAEVNVSVGAPATATPGDWVGGVTVENPHAAPAPGGGAQQIMVTEATEVAVVVHVPGNAQKGAVFLGAASVVVDGPFQYLDVPLKYTGDVLVKPYYSFRLLDASGSVVYQHNGQWDTFVPHTTLVYRLRLDPTLPLGSYRFEGSAGPDQATMAPAHNPVTVGAVPAVRKQAGGTGPLPGGLALMWLLVPVALLVLLLILLVRRAARCSHCRSRRLWGLMRVGDFHEIAHCADCRKRALAREDVRLCPECYRHHVLPSGDLTPHPA